MGKMGLVEGNVEAWCKEVCGLKMRVRELCW